MRPIFSLPFALISLTLLPACNPPKEKIAETPIRPVRYEKVSVTRGLRVHSFSGTARASAESNISFKVSGTLRRLGIKVGDRVKKGTTIAALDAKDFELQVQQADAALQRAQAEARNARARYTRSRQLYETNNASRNDLDAARATAESARASVKSAEKQLELVRRQRSYARITMPGNCAAAVEVEENENIKAGETIAIFNCGKQVEVALSVPENFISGIAINDLARVRFDSLRNQTLDAIVTEVGVSASKNSSTYPVIVSLNNTPSRVRPGMAAEVDFQIAAEGKHISVPGFAVGEDAQGPHLFIVKPGEAGLGTVHRRGVQVGELTESGLLVTEGLKDGELIVTAGVSRITDGQTVRLPGLKKTK